jgi:hypothetical protein
MRGKFAIQKENKVEGYHYCRNNMSTLHTILQLETKKLRGVLSTLLKVPPLSSLAPLGELDSLLIQLFSKSPNE